MDKDEIRLEIESLGRLYVASSQVCRAVMRSQSREELLREVTRVLVDTARFASSFIAWQDPETRELVPAAWSGKGMDHLDQIRMFTDESPQGQGPVGTACREGTPYICNDFPNDPRTLPWRAAADTFGWRASAAFPISGGGIPRGVLSIYAFEEDAFGPDRVELLQQVTSDLESGLEHLAAEERRHQIEAELATSERRFRLALDAAGMGTFDWDLTKGTVFWDRRHQTMFGYEPGSFDGTPSGLYERVHPEDRAAVMCDVEKARGTRTGISREFRIVWPDGSVHWSLGCGEYGYGVSGELEAFTGVVLDITERKRAEVALTRSEERLRQAVRIANIGIFDHDHITGTVYWSPELRSILGIGADAPASPRDYLQAIHPDDRERASKSIQSSHDPANDGSIVMEVRLLLPDGSIRWTRSQEQTFFEGEGEARHPVRTVGAVMDITERVLAQEEQQKLSALADKSPTFIGIAAMDSRVLYLNPAALGLVGLRSIEEAREKSIPDFVAESDRAVSRDGVAQTLLEAGNWSGEVRFRNFQTGELIDVDALAFLIRDDNGLPSYIALVAYEITARKRAEAEREELREQLSQAQKMESIGRLAGGVAHDFNNVLTVINGYSQLLLGKLSADDPIRGSVEEIHKAGERAAGLTQQLLAFTRKQARQPRLLDLNHVVSEMQPVLSRLVGDDVELCIGLHPGPVMVCADPHQLEHVVMNLAVNSRDALPHGGKILIETSVREWSEDGLLSPGGTVERPGRQVMLVISDNGVGMDEETRKHIFEPFFTTKETGKGTGLGLPMVHGIVEQSGGSIDFTSELGRGTTFRIHLPEAEGKTTEEKAPVIFPGLGGKERVLVVEDREEVRNYATAVLTSYGYAAAQVESASEALRFCEREHVDLVLTDVVMPNMTGGELAGRLRARWPEIKVLFMSGYADDAIVQSGGVSGGVELLQKPFSPDQLVTKVRAMLDVTGRSARIVVADDEAGVRGFLKMVLEDGGYEVIEAVNGKQAVEAARAGGVDLVVTDLVMPEQEGIETIRELRKDATGIGIIAISGTFGKQFLNVAKMLGADAVLSKPLTPERLLATIAAVLKSRREAVRSVSPPVAS